MIRHRFHYLFFFSAGVFVRRAISASIYFRAIYSEGNESAREGARSRPDTRATNTFGVPLSLLCVRVYQLLPHRSAFTFVCFHPRLDLSTLFINNHNNINIMLCFTDILIKSIIIFFYNVLYFFIIFLFK